MSPGGPDETESHGEASRKDSKISLDRYGHKKVEVELDEKCPQCGKNLVKRKGRRGLFIACSGYPKCRFTKKLDKPEEGKEEAKPEDKPA